jgi:hypothetical protein
MKRRILSCGLVVLGAGLILIGVGCASTRTSSRTVNRTTLWRGDLDECREVRLSYDLIWDRDSTQPLRKYEQLTVQVSPREYLEFKRAAKTIELKFGVPRGQLRFENVEARTDETRQKIWFVERDTGRIVATLDRETGTVTGPDDEQPPWATSDGGVRLESPAG